MDLCHLVVVVVLCRHTQAQEFGIDLLLVL